MDRPSGTCNPNEKDRAIKPKVITMGCRLNMAESNAMAEQLSDRNDNIIIINSCAVTNEAVRQTRQAVRKAKRSAPNAKIIVTGCAAQVDPKMFAKMPEVYSVLGNHEKQTVQNWLDSDSGSIHVDDIMQIKQTAPQLVSSFSGKSRAFVEIQNGCDHRCTFCIIPYGRGNSRSVPSGKVVDHIKKLVDEGFQEIVLTGVDVTSYGPDLPGNNNLGHLLERILKHVPALRRLRMSSIDGVEIDEHMFDIITSESRIMPHLHLSLQSGDNMILKRMKRRHSREIAVDLVDRLKSKRPDIAIGADIIAGFPTEDEAMFENSKALIKDCQIVHGHIFPYSAKIGTPASNMPQIDGNIIKERARILREECNNVAAQWRKSLIGSHQKILIEKGGASGHAENFAYTQLSCYEKNTTHQKSNIEGEIVPVRIIGMNDKNLLAEML